MPGIPTPMWRALAHAPVLRLHADQWGEHGYIWFEGRVHAFDIDRKCQTDDLRWSGSPAELRARSTDARVLAWLDGLAPA